MITPRVTETPITQRDRVREAVLSEGRERGVYAVRGPKPGPIVRPAPPAPTNLT